MPQLTAIEPFNNYVETYRVPSETFYKFAYVVALNASNEWSCSCPAWIYSEPRKNCKHIRRVINWRKTSSNPPVFQIAKITRFSAMDI